MYPNHNPITVRTWIKGVDIQIDSFHESISHPGTISEEHLNRLFLGLVDMKG